MKTINYKLMGERIRRQRELLGLTREQLAEELDVSKAYAYKIIRQLNDELSAKGFITVAGRVSRQYFSERIYGAERRDD